MRDRLIHFYFGVDARLVWQTVQEHLPRLQQSIENIPEGLAQQLSLFEEGAGQEARFWRLAQALSALYPASSEEKRWVDGVLARKTGLGF